MRRVMLASAVLAMMGGVALADTPSFGATTTFKNGDRVPDWLEHVTNGMGYFGADVKVLRCNSSPEFFVMPIGRYDAVMQFYSNVDENEKETSSISTFKFYGGHMTIKAQGNGSMIFAHDKDLKCEYHPTS